jgi:hypothetical protein
MSKGKQLFRETELTRAIRAAKKEGLRVSKFRINTRGEIEVEIGSATAPVDSAPNEWDDAA